MFDRALDEATELGSTYEGRVFVGTEHLLLGLLRLGEGVGCDILLVRGVNLEETRTELAALFDALRMPLSPTTFRRSCRRAGSGLLLS